MKLSKKKIERSARRRERRARRFARGAYRRVHIDGLPPGVRIGRTRRGEWVFVTKRKK